MSGSPFEQREAGRQAAARQQCGRCARWLGRAAIAFHWQGDKQGTAWRQEGHYQRLGQTEIRASFGPVRQSRGRAGRRAHARTRTHKHKGWKVDRGKTAKPRDLHFEDERGGNANWG